MTECTTVVFFNLVLIILFGDTDLFYFIVAPMALLQIQMVQQCQLVHNTLYINIH